LRNLDELFRRVVTLVRLVETIPRHCTGHRARHEQEHHADTD
jgi:hypothetical protein